MDDPSSDTLEFQPPFEQETKPVTRTFCLIVMEGPEKGATFGLASGTHTIGRAEECDILVKGRGVSRVHAIVRVKAHGDVIIEDQGSTNGVYVDGERITRQEIEPGQTVAIGPSVKLRLELSASSVQELLREMYESTTLDSLTGLLTRRGFEERLDVEFAMVHRHQMHSCLAVIDLDRFKGINDREGHDGGDLVLQAVACHIKDTVRTGDLAGRWGGEEFVVYIRQTPLVGAMTMLERLRQSVADTPVKLPKGTSTQVTFSAGVVDLLDFEDWRAAFRQADQTMYEAKSEGRNRVIFHSS